MRKIAKILSALGCAMAATGHTFAKADDSPAVVLTPVSHVQLGDTWYYIPPDTYTRLVICENLKQHRDCGETNKSEKAIGDTEYPTYPYQARGWLARFFVGIGHSENLSVNVKAGKFLASVPLVSISHDSTRTSGEGFSRSVYYKAMDYPLFLVRGTGDGEVAQADVKMGATDKVTSYAAGTTLAAVVAVTRAIASPPPLLTTLAVDTNKAVANSIDKTIGSLFGVSITEEQIEDQKIARWRDVEITLMVPNEEGKWNKRKNGDAVNETDFARAGTWLLYFDYPHMSAFSGEIVKCTVKGDTSIGAVEDNEGVEVGEGADICNKQVIIEKNTARTSAKRHYADVLDFPVIVNHDNPITIADFLKQQDWWNPALNAIATPADHAPDADAIDAFCRQIRAAIGDQGFNTLDQYLVVAAVGQSALLSRAEGNALTTDSCIDPTSTDPAELAAISVNTAAAATKAAARRSLSAKAAHPQHRT